jgi:pimeloyl-ACP methyl ester carboxylesterase
MQVAQQYIRIYAPGLTQTTNAIIAAPASERGWGFIGYSLIFSTISKVQRLLPIDPGRIYLTGQSMGGHLTYRMALLFPDRFGAVSPHSGGYNFAEKGSIANLLNVPGRAIFGSTEPYGINEDNKANETWAKTHNLNWTFIEKDGGHTIYTDELPSLATFFQQNPRNPYPKKVYLKQGGSMLFTKTWEIKGWPKHTIHHETRPMRWNRRHWIEVQANPETKDPQELLALNLGENQIQITCQNVRDLTVYLHPKMVDFEKPITITVNGKKVFQGKVKPDMALILNKARTSDDRGQIYWAKLTIPITTDGKVEL